MNWFADETQSDGLNTIPRKDLGIILVTGATGYVGGRLVTSLIDRGYKVRIMARVDGMAYERRWPLAEVITADALVPDQLEKALEGVDVAYYLIHSLLLGAKNYKEADKQAAINFREKAEKAGVRRIIYLGALAGISRKFETHQLSRYRVSEELQRSSIPVTVLRAAMIIGSGSVAYEIFKNLVNKSPVILIPKWAKSRSQPISIRNLINILIGVLETEETAGKSYAVGGSEVITYERMLKILSAILQKKRVFRNTRISNPRFYSFMLSMITPVPEALIRPLVEGSQEDIICGDQDPVFKSMYQPIMFKQAVLRAMTREELDKVHTRWSDEFPPAYELAMKLTDLKKPPVFISSYSLRTAKQESSLFNSFCRIGGEEGWLHSNWMWKIRGWFDKLFLGVGIIRGRRSATDLRLHDVIDFWRVEDIQKDLRLLLRAEMKLPGMAWLEFRIEKVNGDNSLVVTAYYEPRGLRGRLYWYFFLPFHHVIFTNILKEIDLRS